MTPEIILSGLAIIVAVVFGLPSAILFFEKRRNERKERKKSREKLVEMMRDLRSNELITEICNIEALGVKDQSELERLLGRMEAGDAIEEIENWDEITKRVEGVVQSDTNAKTQHPRSFINVGYELRAAGYDTQQKDQPSQLTDLREECLKRIESELEILKKRVCKSQDNKPFNVLILGGMSHLFAQRVLDKLCENLAGPIDLYIDGKGAQSPFRNCVTAWSAKKRSITVRVIVNNGSIDVEYDIIISSHYFQHRRIADLTEIQYCLRENGLLIWFSAISRSPKAGPCEYVAEGFPPFIPYRPEAKRSAKGGVKYWRMDRQGIGEIAYKLSKGESDKFLRAGITRAFAVEKQVLEDKNSRFVEALKEFMSWSFGLRLDSFEINILSWCAANEEANSRFSECEYGIIKMKEKQDPEKLFLYTAQTQEGGKELIVTLHSARSKGSSGGYGEKNVRSVHERNVTFKNNPEFNHWQYELVGELVGENNNINIQVWKVGARIRYPFLSHHIYMLNGGIIYLADLPFRKYLTEIEYNECLDRLNETEKKIEEFKENAQKPVQAKRSLFTPYRMDSFAILRSYLTIKEALACKGISVDDRQTFFHKCYGEIENPWWCLDKRKREILKSPKACIDKDRIFNEWRLSKRLKLLGVMNVHDVLLFGIKKGSK